MLQLENRHIVSLTGLFKVAENHSKIVKLELSSNRIETLAGIEALKDTLLEFDVSMNQICKVSSLEDMQQLHTINLSNNLIEGLEWCENNKGVKRLKVLDLSYNDLEAVREIGKLKYLRKLNLQSNYLTHVLGVHKCKHLVELNVQKNKLTDIDCLLSCVQLETLNISYNNISDVVQLAKVVCSLEKLKHLMAFENPVEKLENYRFRMLQNKSIVFLDYTNIRPYLRDQIEEMEGERNLLDLVEETSNEYTLRIQRERSILDQGLNFYRDRQDMMLKTFSEYKRNLETELDDCVTYAEAVCKNKRAYLLNPAGLQEWKQTVDDLVKNRIIDDAERESLKASLKNTKLTEQAQLLRPEVWRAMKEKELELSEKEEEKVRQLVLDRKERSAETLQNLMDERRIRTLQAVESTKKYAVDDHTNWSGTVKRIQAHVEVKDEKSKARKNALMPSKGMLLAFEEQAKAGIATPRPETPEENPTKSKKQSSRKEKEPAAAITSEPDTPSVGDEVKVKEKKHRKKKNKVDVKPEVIPDVETTRIEKDQNDIIDKSKKEKHKKSKKEKSSKTSDKKGKGFSLKKKGITPAP